MPRFSVGFGRRKSTADNLENEATAEPSFRVLERTEVASGKSFDGGARFVANKTHTFPKPNLSEIRVDDNLFADLKTNRGSGSSNTTKTVSTDTSSRHSNVSTAPSSADLSNHQDEPKNTHRKPLGDGAAKSTSGFLRTAGRTFSFGQKKQSASGTSKVPDEPVPPLRTPPAPKHSEELFTGGRSRATTASTSTTVTPPTLDEEFNFDLGGDFGKMFGFDKRASVMTIRGNEANGRQSLGPRSLTSNNRVNQPSPISIDKTANIDAAPHSLDSHHSNEGLLTHPSRASPGHEHPLPPVPRQPSPLSGASSLRPVTSPETKKLSGFFGRRTSPVPPPVPSPEEAEDEDAKLLKDSLSAVNKFMSGGGAAKSGTNPAPRSRYERDDDGFGSPKAQPTQVDDSNMEDDNLFETSLAHSSRVANRFVARKPSPPRNKVMTPAQFERYRQDKERQSTAAKAEQQEEDKSDEEEIDYDDDEDETEKARQQAKQRRKQEAHMAVYRQQMMKVTGESGAVGGHTPSRPSLSMSFSTPNLPNLAGPNPVAGKSDSEEDEEVPLAILAAHGFPNKARPPTRLSTMMSNPNLRASQQPSYQRAGSVSGDAAPAAGGGGRLPAFARNLPRDPFLGAGLVHNPVREQYALNGGAPAPPGAVPPGGLVGVIVNEERSRAMRRGSPAVDRFQPMPNDPINGIPSHMMYPNRPVSNMMMPGDQAQMQAQMQQFMQMQMQFMQMMTGQQGGNPGSRPTSQMPPPQMMGAPNDMGGMLGMPNMGVPGPDMRHSFVGNGYPPAANGSVVDLPRPDMRSRTMSMVQPSSSSWIQQPPPNHGFAPSIAPSIHIQGVGYAPSIAPSERSNVGLPGRYRPVSHMPPAVGEQMPRTSTMSGAFTGWDKQEPKVTTMAKKSGNSSDDDDEEGWAAMKEKREKKRSIWKSKKSFGADIGALIS